jgi:hypothetical protein
VKQFCVLVHASLRGTLVVVPLALEVLRVQCAGQRLYKIERQRYSSQCAAPALRLPLLQPWQ